MAHLLQVTLPGIAPGVLAAALLVFALSIDDYVVTSFVAGVGSTTLPIQIYSMVRSGITPEINAVSTRAPGRDRPAPARGLAPGARRRGRAARRCRGLGLAVLGAPFLLGRGAGPAASGC